MDWRMSTLGEGIAQAKRSGQPTGWFGDAPMLDWVVAAGVHRDSDTIDRSNWRVLLARLGGEGRSVRVVRFSHWAVGWVDCLCIGPRARAKLRIASKARRSIRDYPILDDSDHSELEWTEFMDFAESELSALGPDWHERIRTDDRLCIGDEGSEWDCIERIRKSYEQAA